MTSLMKMSSACVDRWLIVAAAFVNNCLFGAHIGCFSLFYPAITSDFRSDYQASGWIGSISQASVYLPAFLYSSAVNKYGCRRVAVIGAFVTSVGQVTSAFAPSIPVLYLTYGVISGIGTGLYFLPTIAIVQRSFTSHRALAAGLSLSGMGIGIAFMSPLTEYLIEMYTWRGAMFISGAICLQGVPCGMLFVNSYANTRINKAAKEQCYKQADDPQLSDNSSQNDKNHYYNDKDKLIPNDVLPSYETFQTNRTRSVSENGIKTEAPTRRFCDIFDFALLKDVRFLLYAFGTFAFNMCMSTHGMHTPSRALTYGIPSSKIGLLPTAGGLGNITGRLLFSFISNAQCVNRTLLYAIGALLAGILTTCSIVATTFEVIATFSVTLGFCFGISLTVQPTVLGDLFTVDKIVRSQSLLNLFVGMAGLVTTPFAGFLFDFTGNYNIPFLVNGLIGFFGSLLLIATCCLQWKLTVEKVSVVQT